MGDFHDITIFFENSLVLEREIACGSSVRSKIKMTTSFSDNQLCATSDEQVWG